MSDRFDFWDYRDELVRDLITAGTVLSDYPEETKTTVARAVWDAMAATGEVYPFMKLVQVFNPVEIVRQQGLRHGCRRSGTQPRPHHEHCVPIRRVQQC